MCGRRAAVQFGAAQGGSAAGPTVRRFLSACEGCWTAFCRMGKVTDGFTCRGGDKTNRQ
jgi:hypothetical protein